MAHGASLHFNQDPLDILEWDKFDYLVPEFGAAGAGAFLPDEADTAARLRALAKTMVFDPGAQDPGSNMPAPYTYLGQFVDHDITQTTAVGATSPDELIQKTEVRPLDRHEIRSLLRNRRTSGFDLDSLYGLQPPPDETELAVPFTGDRFDLGTVVPVGNRPPNKDDHNDLPRVTDPKSPRFREARIGDPRNDENTIVAQLHLAFLKFHNAVVDDGFAFDDARRLVTHHYQWVILTDFLPRVCDPTVIRDVLQHGTRLYRPRGVEKFMPFEFAVAAYRFGHSLIRQTYDFNQNFRRVPGVGLQSVGSLELVFEFTKKSGDLDGHPTLAENWIIEWELMFADRAMPIDPTLTPMLATLPKETDPMKFLAARNLLRGYLFALPTGQALAAAVLPAEKRLTLAELQAACRAPDRPDEKGQWDVLKELELHERTPLWFYVLAEAKAKGNGNHLGPLGSLIVAETIVGLMQANPTSILNVSFIPTLGPRPGQFDLQDLLMKAGALSRRVAE
ncbi:heme peroxidase family protein [Mitsuaria sp. CC2]|uniref:peroxidase family protein n=1 Tax=Mitsuaria sp. CC2 TaxID=3029186 RepID=UPI003B8AD3D4